MDSTSASIAERTLSLKWRLKTCQKPRKKCLRKFLFYKGRKEGKTQFEFERKTPDGKTETVQIFACGLPEFEEDIE
ncbi:hypothetical protein ACVRZC_06040 [Streptococcus hyointestinalis]|uniref:Uncharacterized protein n=1 Tax=Streptococcus hyointestinalis TaxID=1337 RepID=A0A380JYY0_9STRE|nr:hypothetical protein [Streptococcus hyointestinalis]SUN57948.1 Uncharacterised protein [Streptococcus hyointestinalis]